MRLPVSFHQTATPVVIAAIWLQLFYRPQEDERLSWPSWLAYSGRFTHINGYPSAAGQVQTRESSPVRDRRSIPVIERLSLTITQWLSNISETSVNLLPCVCGQLTSSHCRLLAQIILHQKVKKNGKGTPFA